MIKIRTALFLAASAAFATPSLAAVTFYTGSAGEAQFAATTGSYISTVTFDSEPLAPYGNESLGTSFTRQGVTVSGQYAMSALGPTYPNNNNATSNSYGLAHGTVLDPEYSNLTIDFATPVTAFGIDFAAQGRGTQGSAGHYTYLTANDSFTFTLAGTSDTVTYTANQYVNGARFDFFGVTSDTAFSSVTITHLSPTTNSQFDNISFGAAPAGVPEPASWALMIGGLGLVGGSMRQRQRKTVAA